MTLLGGREQLGDLLRGGLAVLAVVLLAAARRRRDAEAAGDHGDERAVHRLAHDVGQVGTRRPDQRAGDDEQVVAQQEARGRRGPAGVAVEHRHHDRHVAAADRGHQVHAQRQRDDGDRHQHGQRRGDDEPHGERGERDQRTQVQRVLARQHQRLGREPPVELAPRDDRAGEGHRADEHADDHLGAVDAQQRRGEARRDGFDQRARLDLEVAVPAHQDRGEADEAVEQRDQLGHAGHRHPVGPDHPDHRADHHRADQQPDADRGHAVGQRQDQRGDQRDRHPGDAEDVARPGRLVPGQPGEGEDEQQRGDEVGGAGDGVCGHGVSISVHSVSATPEHGEHAAGHGETAEDVDGGQQDRQRCQDRDQRACRARPAAGRRRR